MVTDRTRSVLVIISTLFLNLLFSLYFMTLQCVKFLACKLVLNSCFVSHELIFLSLNLQLILYLFLSLIHCTHDLVAI